MTGGNRALHTNPFVVNDRTVDIHITTRGSDWYWTVMSIMGTTWLVILGSAFLKPASNRIFHYLLAAVAFVAMIEHYSIASNLGWVPIDVEWHRSSHLTAGANRQIWYVRYIAWFITWPLLTLALLLTVVAPAAVTLWTLFLSATMAVLAEVGALVRTDYKWGYYAFWLFSWCLLGYYLVFAPRRYATALGSDIGRIHISGAGWIWFLWMLYPICWGVSEGGNVIPPDSELIFYGILDVLLIPVTSAVFLFQHWRVDPARLGLRLRSYDDPVVGGRSGAPADVEKPIATNGAAATNGATAAEPAPATTTAPTAP